MHGKIWQVIGSVYMGKSSIMDMVRLITALEFHYVVTPLLTVNNHSGINMRTGNLIRILTLIAATVAVQSSLSQTVKLEDLASLKAIQSSSVSFKRSLKLPSGEFSVGDDAGKIPPASLLSDYKLDSSSPLPGVVTACPDGVKDNQALPGCKIVGITNTYMVSPNNAERWVSDTKAQLIGNANWFISPQNESENAKSLIRLANIYDSAFEGCVTRLTKTTEPTSEPCFKTTNNDERISLNLRLCRASINGIRGNLIVTNADRSPHYCAVDPKSGLAVALTYNEQKGRMGLAIFSILPLYELGDRMAIQEKINEQRKYSAPARL